MNIAAINIPPIRIHGRSIAAAHARIRQRGNASRRAGTFAGGREGTTDLHI